MAEDKDAKTLGRVLKEQARKSVIVSTQKALAESRKAFQSADEIRSRSKTLLRPDDILDGKADAGKLWRYMTSQPDGSVRPITLQDVIEFDKRRAALRDKWQKGIRAKDIVDLSRAVVPGQKQSDLAKAREQINAAVPVSTKAGELRFSTNSGPNSDVQRHLVTVKMLNFEAAVASPTSPAKIAKDVTGGPLAIGCDCGQWRFVFAYMATVGGYNLPEHRETAFPKLKNPRLSGVACKHIVKVASMLAQSPTMAGFVARLIEKERNRTQSKLDRNKMAAQREFQEELAKESSRQRAIKTTEEKRAARQAQPSYQRQLQRRQAEAEAKAAQKAQRMAERQSQAKQREIQAHVAQLLSLGAITQKQADAILAGKKG